MELFDELKRLLGALNAAGIDFALCGGFALAAHGIVRATEDIDVILPREVLSRLRTGVEPLGYRMQATPFRFKDGDVEIYRFVKSDAAVGDFLVLDVLIVTPAIQSAWDSRHLLDTQFGRVHVVSRTGLIHLKSLRGSGQDQDDILRLKQLDDRANND
jgi:hypothetical protein